MRRYLLIFLYLFLLVFLTAGCAADQAAANPLSGTEPQIAVMELLTATPTLPSATALPTQTATSEPTKTPTPLPTETSSATPTITPTPEPAYTTLLFTGAIVPGRCVQAAIDERGNADFLYADVSGLISDADIAVGTLNAALSDFPPHKGCIDTFVLVGSSINADAMARAGFDVMSVATNHIKNCGLTSCGDRAFFDTMDNLERVGILPVGAGDNYQEAMQPVVVEKNGIRFGFVSLGEIEPLAFASENTPGIAPLPRSFDVADQNLRTAIAAAREVSDVVIVMPHWGSDYSDMPNYRQLHFDQVAVEAGADLVIGNHPHVIQGMRKIAGIPVFYSLGSFVFDQDWSLETQQGIVVVVTFRGTEFVGYQIIPVHIDGDGHVQVAEALEAADILERFQTLSGKLK